MIVENHIKGSKRGHKEEREDARADGMKRKSIIEFDRKLVEIKAKVCTLTKLLQ